MSTVLPLSLAGCAGTIDSAELATRLATSGQVPVVLDVRSGDEYEAGHLLGAINIPVLALPFQMTAVPVRVRSEPVVVYCAHGPRAGLAGFFLRLAGFSQVYHLLGDIRVWRDEGRPLVTGAFVGARIFGNRTSPTLGR